MREQSLKLLINLYTLYLGVTFTAGGSFHETQKCLAGKALSRQVLKW